MKTGAAAMPSACQGKHNLKIGTIRPDIQLAVSILKATDGIVEIIEAAISDGTLPATIAKRVDADARTGKLSPAARSAAIKAAEEQARSGALSKGRDAALASVSKSLQEQDKDGRYINKYFNYAVVSCAEPNISLSSETSISREKLGYMVIGIDVTCVLLSVLYIWYLEYNMKANVKLQEKPTV